MASREGRKRPGRRLPVVGAVVIATAAAVAIDSGGVRVHWVLGLVAIAVSLATLQSTCRVLRLSRLSVPAVWYYSYLAMIALPAFAVYSAHEGPYRASYFLAVFSALITVPLGVMLVARVAGWRPSELDQYYERPLEAPAPTPGVGAVYVVALAAAVALNLRYLAEVETVPLFYMLQHPGEYIVLTQLREESFKLLDSPLAYAYFMLRVLIYPFLALVALGYALRTRRWTWYLLSGVSIAAALLYAGLSIAKAPVAGVMLLLFLYLYLHRAGRAPLSGVVAAGALVMAFPVVVVLGVFAEQGVTLNVALQAIAKRVFYDPSETLYYYFEVVPDQVGYLHGRTIGKFAALTGQPYFDLENYVSRYVHSGWIETGSANAAFLGNAHADFGVPGVLLGGVLVGGLLQAVQIYFCRRRKTVPTLAACAFAFFAAWLLNSTSLPTVLLSNGLMLAVLLPTLLSLGEDVVDGTMSPARRATTRIAAGAP